MKSIESITEKRHDLLDRVESLPKISLTEKLLTNISIQNEFILDTLLDIREILIKTNDIKVE